MCVCVCCFCIWLLLSGDKYVVNLSADQTLSQRRDLDHMISRLRLSRQISSPPAAYHTFSPKTKAHAKHALGNHAHVRTQSPRCTKPPGLIRKPKVLTLVYQIHLAFAHYYKATVHFHNPHPTPPPAALFSFQESKIH